MASPRVKYASCTTDGLSVVASEIPGFTFQEPEETEGPPIGENLMDFLDKVGRKGWELCTQVPDVHLLWPQSIGEHAVNYRSTMIFKLVRRSPV